MSGSNRKLVMVFFLLSFVIGVPLATIAGHNAVFGVVAITVALAMHVWARVTGRMNG